jgi:hypothetical protein
MATAGIILTADIQNLTELQEALRKALPPEAKAEILRAAMEKAIEPLFNRLKAVTPVGPTGNLRRAAAKKVVAYPKSGNCVGLVGYKRAGSGRSRSAQGGRVRTGRDRAFHQYWLEEGTLPRLVTTYSNTTYAGSPADRQLRFARTWSRGRTPISLPASASLARSSSSPRRDRPRARRGTA